jgi:hypothetical protein
MITSRSASIVALAFAISLVGCMPAPNPNGGNSSVASSSSSVGNPNISVSSPQPNATVSSPLTVTGEARGTWYFEASFPVRVLDANGNVLAAVPAQAQGDWMTTDFVPFTATLTFNATTATGTIVFEKDNPSDLPENAASVIVPVQF